MLSWLDPSFVYYNQWQSLVLCDEKVLSSLRKDCAHLQPFPCLHLISEGQLKKLYFLFPMLLWKTHKNKTKQTGRGEIPTWEQGTSGLYLIHLQVVPALIREKKQWNKTSEWELLHKEGYSRKYRKQQFCNFAKAVLAGLIPLAKYFKSTPLFFKSQLPLFLGTRFGLYCQKKQSQMLKS